LKKNDKNIYSLLPELKAGKILPVYLLYGEEEFPIKSILDQAVDLVIDESAKDFNFDVFYANEVDAPAIVNVAMSYPMMAERRLVVVKNLHQMQDSGLQLIASYCEKPSETTCLFLTGQKLNGKNKHIKKIKSSAITFESKLLYDNQVPSWLTQYASEQGLSITPKAIALLQSNVGNSLKTLSVEIEKIKLNLAGKTEINEDDVENVVGVSREFNIFELNDAIAEHRFEQGLKILDRMLQLGESPIGILVMLTRHFFTIAKVKEMKIAHLSKNEIASRVRINPYFVDKYAKQSQRYSRKELEQVFTFLQAADLHIKTSYQKPKLELEVLFFNIGNLVSNS